MVLVGLGGALVVAGPDRLAQVGRLVGANLHILLFVLAGGYVYLVVMPRGIRLGPLVLVVAGFLAYLFTYGPGRLLQLWSVAGGLLILLGGRLALSKAARFQRLAGPDPVRREVAVLLPRTVQIPIVAPVADHLSVIAVGTRITVRLPETVERSTRDFVELGVTSWGGYVQVEAPPNWLVVAGRLHGAHGTDFAGALDSGKAFTDPPREGEELARLLEGRRQEVEGHPEHARLLIIHVMGLGGSVLVNP